MQHYDFPIEAQRQLESPFNWTSTPISSINKVGILMEAQLGRPQTKSLVKPKLKPKWPINHHSDGTQTVIPCFWRSLYMFPGYNSPIERQVNIYMTYFLLTTSEHMTSWYMISWYITPWLHDMWCHNVWYHDILCQYIWHHGIWHHDILHHDLGCLDINVMTYDVS